MTGRELLDFLNTLDEEELSGDVEIKSAGLKSGFCFAEGCGVDCNGIYVMDALRYDEFAEHMSITDKISEVV